MRTFLLGKAYLSYPLVITDIVHFAQFFVITFLNSANEGQGWQYTVMTDLLETCNFGG